MNERQEIHCHDCQQYVQFDIDVSLNGNHVLNCPNCGHEHCRVVKDGIITEDRWDSRNGDSSIMISTATMTSTATSTWNTSTAGAAYSGTTAGTDASYYLYDAWLNR